MRYRVCFDDCEFALPPGESLIGREAASRVRVGHPSVSRRHARLLVAGDGVTIEDLGSKNGVQVNTAPVVGPTRLTDGDRVRVGSVQFVLREDSAFEVDDVTGVDEWAPQVTAPHPLARYRDPLGRRASRRVPVRLRGLYVSPTLTLDGEVTDLSTGGAFFRCELLDAVGTACDLLVFDGDDVVRFGAVVARVAGEGARPRGAATGVGLRLVRVSAVAERWLHQVAAPTAA